MKYLILLLLLTSCKPVPTNPDFELDVKPILQMKCYSCHGNHWLDKQVFDSNLKLIRKMVVETYRMPPGGIDKLQYETIRNYIDNRLKD